MIEYGTREQISLTDRSVNMAPRGRTSRNGPNVGRSATVSNLALRESRPIPYIQTPPTDPPSIRKNRPVDLSLKWKPTASEGTDVLTQANVQAALKDYGYDSSNQQFFYTVNYVYAWADSSLDAVTLSLYDVATGVSTTDNGATTRRARVGLHYPKVLQVPQAETSTGLITGVTISTNVPSEIDMRIGVTVWMKTSNL
jgi:hypothetical protein